MYRFLFAAFCALFASSPIFAKSFADLYPDIAPQLSAEEQALVEKIDFQQGKILIGNKLATIDVGSNYYYLNPTDSAHVLEKIWGNPPGGQVLGMVFPVDISPLHSNGWGMELRYDDIGYVSDDDAESHDYDELLKEMQADTIAENKWRAENGYQPIELLGWAEPPFYDNTSRTLYWAKELQFGDAPEHTLNFNIRLLGRRGVLVQNFITTIGELERVKTDLPDVLAMTSFTDGNRYSDFDPSLDKVAAVGVGGLVAGKVLAKTGFLAIALVFLKKAWFLLFIPLVWLKNLFTRKQA